jgi:hypothetical protein
MGHNPSLLKVRGDQVSSRDIRFQHTDHDLVSVQSVFEAAKVLAFMALYR